MMTLPPTARAASQNPEGNANPNANANPNQVQFLRGGDAQTAKLLEHVEKSMLPAHYGGERRAEDMPVPGLEGEPIVEVLDVNGRPVSEASSARSSVAGTGN